MRSRWLHSSSDSDWLSRALAFVAAEEAQALAARGEFHIVLAGGETPRRLYRALAEELHDWLRWRVWFGDERCLPPGHPQRNSGMAADLLAHIAPADVFPIPAERGPRAAAEAYAASLAPVGTFDLVLLGLGEDGHSASLFPGYTGSALEPDALPVFDAPKPPPERVSLSAARLSRTRRALFLVSGAGKQNALNRWRAGEPIPAAAIQPEAGVDVLLGPDLKLTGVAP